MQLRNLKTLLLLEGFFIILYHMRTTLILIITYLFGDVVNPYYLFISLYVLSFIGIYFFWKKKKRK